ncbi:TPA: hypothetical protein ENG04_11855 [Candidatus Poribacteria bacterium]|nr:hypothetical protein [Candidatus Poribacteria bacterium]HEX30762.1 hypothetical protein [Candidatus Poribacteria bacterium]
MRGESVSPVKFSDLMSGLPQIWPEDLLPSIRERIALLDGKLIVLDDDPTGCQTVHDVPLYTGWEEESLRSALREESHVVYILTNSRSLLPDEAAELARTIGQRLSKLSEELKVKLFLVSRSDSTLRGHFPTETNALAEGLSMSFDATFIIPFFLEGGRYTVNDAHWVRQGEMMIPAAQTEYARDPAFGYIHSYLPKWVEEKTGGMVKEDEVERISIWELRKEGPEKLSRRLMELEGGRIVIVNAADYRDLDVLSLALLDAEISGKRFLYRTAASFVRSRGGITPGGVLSGEELLPQTDTEPGALVIVGSYVGRTTRQMQKLLEMPDTIGIEVRIADLLGGERGKTIDRITRKIEEMIKKGLIAVLFTERKPVKGFTPEESLKIGRRISSALAEITRGLNARPSFILAKGGITSHDIAVKGLGISRTMVLGQIYPGVPVWKVKDIPYVVFPGNVGDDEAMVEVVRKLRP